MNLSMSQGDITPKNSAMDPNEDHKYHAINSNDEVWSNPFVWINSKEFNDQNNIDT